MPTLCIILARGGSKGLPRKNALPVAGRPMLCWTLAHALETREALRLALSTDDPELGGIAAGEGVPVVYRPPGLADDTAAVDTAARHAATHLEAEAGHRYDPIVLLYGNVPVRPADLTDRALVKLRETGADSVQSVCDVGKHHPYWVKRLESGEGDRLQAYEPNAVYRRQDLPPVYALDGGIIVVRRAALFHEVGGVEPGPHAFLGCDQRAVVTQPGEVVDVDADRDLRVAEAALRQQPARRWVG